MDETGKPQGLRSAGRASGERAKTELARTRLSKQKRRVFLEHLAATCNVKLAAAAAGPGASYFYNLRRVDVEFAAGWDAAVRASYDRLEEALVARAIKEVAADQFDPGAVTLVLTDARDAPGGASEAAAPDKPANGRRSSRGTAPAAGISDKIARVDAQLALAMLNRRAALERNGRERHSRRRPSAAEVEKALNDKLDKLARRITPLGGREG